MSFLHEPTVSFPRTASGRRNGFTLVELLITMMVILVISGLVITAVGGNDGSNDLNAAIRRADSVFSLARSAAISRKTPVRVMISYDSTRGGRKGEFLRYLTIYYLEPNPAHPGPNEPKAHWKPFAEGEYLPAGIFFDVAKMNEFRVWTLPSVSSQEIIVEYEWIPEDLLNNFPEFPVNIPSGSNRWIVFEFHPNGTVRYPMSRVVLGRAIEPSETLNVIPNKYMRAGFVLFRSGKVTHYQSPEHLVGALGL